MCVRAHTHSFACVCSVCKNEKIKNKNLLTESTLIQARINIFGVAMLRIWAGKLRSDTKYNFILSVLCV